MEDHYQIRPAKIGDLSEVAAIEQTVFSDPWSPGMLRRAFEDQLALVAVDEDGAVVGYLLASAIGDEGEILNLAVHPAYRRRGLGARLTTEGLDLLRFRGVRQVFLEVRESNAGARRLYQSLEFEPVARRRWYYRNPREDALILTRALRTLPRVSAG